MFYARFILAKKGPLARVWLAAHLERKLSRELVFETKVDEAVEMIKKPTVKISLRTNGHLLLGIVRIYSKKALYVLQDLLSAWRAFRHTEFRDQQGRRVRNPHRRRTRVAVAAAPVEGAIQEEPEEEEDLDEEMPNLREFADAPGPEFNVQANLENITLNGNEDYINSMSFINENYGASEMQIDNFDQELDNAVEELRRSESVASGRLVNDEQMEVDGSIELARQGSMNQSNLQQLSTEFLAPAIPDYSMHQDLCWDNAEDVPPEVLAGFEQEDPILEPENSGINLLPLSESQICRDIEEQRRPRRRRPRNLIVDEETTLNNDEIREWMQKEPTNYIELAPPTKKAMIAKEKSSLTYIFNNPATHLYINPKLNQFYHDHCVPQLRPNLENIQPTALQIRESLGMVDDPLPEPLDLLLPPRSPTPSFRAQTPILDNENLEVAHRTNSTIVDFQNDLSEQPMDPNMIEDEADENADPFAPPPFKRARSTFDANKSQPLSRQVEATKKTLLNQLKAKSTEIGASTVDFHSTILPAVRDLSLVSDAVREKLRQKTASNFYALLELQKDRSVELNQSEAYGPIEVTITA
ncbi:hypothetical protein M3Y94_00720500 [Aphelenchoides besseyi]|nr:hypothetical protein M3Y94_00720500 [Aphelenchoides besseyi]KAI6231798.1 hypothetical protein M3Y95_00419400 [Aphelenchoides besseyi]